MIGAQASGIVSEITRLRGRETRADKTLSQIRAVDCNDRNGAAIRRRRHEPDRRGLGTQGVRGEILCGLPTLPTSLGAPTELPALECVDPKQPEIDGHGIAIERPRLRVETLRP